MREITIKLAFRAWNIDEKQMIYSTDPSYCFEIKPGKIIMYRKKGNVLYLINHSPPDQSLCMEDNKGQLIYEKDIIFCGAGEHYHGNWEYSEIRELESIFDIFHLEEFDYLEVLGNLHEEDK